MLAYGGIPVAASLVLWIFTALLVGEAAIIEKPAAEVDGFVGFVLHAQLAAYLLLLVLEHRSASHGIQRNSRTRHAKSIRGLGAGASAMRCSPSLFLSILIGLLFPGLVPPTPH